MKETMIARHPEGYVSFTGIKIPLTPYYIGRIEAYSWNGCEHFRKWLAITSEPCRREYLQIERRTRVTLPEIDDDEEDEDDD